MHPRKSLPIAFVALCTVLTPTLGQLPAASLAADGATTESREAPPSSTLDERDLLGQEVVAADSKPIGRISKVNVAEGKIRSVEVEAGGVWGFFTKTYVLPADRVVRKKGRVELALTSDLVWQFEQ